MAPPRAQPFPSTIALIRTLPLSWRQHIAERLQRRPRLRCRLHRAHLLRLVPLFPLVLSAPVLPLIWPPSTAALELRGRTYFTSPPVKVLLRNYYSQTWEAGGEYYFTVALPPNAGASLGGLQIQQTAGADWSFSFLVSRTRAFLGQPRREGAAVPLDVSFEQEARRFSIHFPQPVAPGETVTVALRPMRNPAQADTYLFAVTAFPAGPNPQGASLGFGRLAIYDPTPF